MRFFKTRIRVVRDRYAGHEVQFRHWWMPFYFQLGGTNTHRTLEEAICYAQNYHKELWSNDT